MSKKAQSAFAASSVIPARVVNIAVDTSYLYSQTSGPYSGIGIYMMDNNDLGGSSGEGGLELHTLINANMGMAFNVFPIDEAGQTGSHVEIVGFEVSSGTNIFGNWGYPAKQPATSSYQWIGTAMVQGECTYQIKIGVSIAGAPMQYYWWDPFITCVG